MLCTEGIATSETTDVKGKLWHYQKGHLLGMIDTIKASNIRAKVYRKTVVFADIFLFNS